MATHDYIIDNQSAPAFRADLNGALQAIVTQNSNATAPTTTYANMIWYDTAANQLKKRNEANSAWIILGTVDEGLSTFTPSGVPAIATQAEAQAGTDNTKMMTPLRVAQAIPSINAGLLAGGIGTYAFAVLISGTVPATGGTTAGSNLAYTHANSLSGSGTPPGTWQLMGWVAGTGLNGRSLWLRIS